VARGRRATHGRRRAAAGGSGGPRAWLLVVVGLAAVSLLLFDRPLVRGDGLAYYMWLEPIAGGRGFDLSGPAARFASVNEYQVFRYPPTGRWASAFSFGPAVLLGPWYLLGGQLPDPAWVDSAHYWRWQAEPFARSFAVMLGANLLVAAAAGLAWSASVRVGAPAALAAFAALAALWGTPLLYYGSVEPFMAHGPGAFALALAVWLAARPAPNWLLVGLALALAALMRWQLVLTALPFALMLLVRRDWSALGRLLAGTAALAWLVPLSWWTMFGSVTAVPAAEQNMRPFLTGPAFLLDVVVSAERGWLVWSPLAGLGCLGLIVLARHRPALGWPLLGAVVLQLLINASVTEWQAGWSFGMRRMADLYAVYAVGLGVLLAAATGPVGALVRIGTAAALAWGVVLFVAHLSYINAVQGWGGPALDEVQHLVGSRLGPRVALDAIAGHYGPWAWPRPGP